MLGEHTRVDSKKLEYGCSVIYAGFPAFSNIGIRGRSYSDFLVSTVSGVIVGVTGLS